jgi:hypothetical protein
MGAVSLFLSLRGHRPSSAALVAVFAVVLSLLALYALVLAMNGAIQLEIASPTAPFRWGSIESGDG